MWNSRAKPGRDGNNAVSILGPADHTTASGRRAPCHPFRVTGFVEGPNDGTLMMSTATSDGATAADEINNPACWLRNSCKNKTSRVEESAPRLFREVKADLDTARPRRKCPYDRSSRGKRSMYLASFGSSRRINIRILPSSPGR